MLTLFVARPPPLAIQMRRNSRTQSGKHIQIGITCNKYYRLSDYNLRMAILSPSMRSSNCWTGTRALERICAPGMKTTRRAIGRGHNVPVGPKHTSTRISNDDHTFAMVLNAGLTLGRQIFLLSSYSVGPIQPPDHLFWFNSRASFYSSEDLYAHQTRGNHVQCTKWYVSRLLVWLSF